MTATEKQWIIKMCRCGAFPLKTKGRKLLFIDSNKPLTEERKANLKKEGIGLAELKDSDGTHAVILYYEDDYYCIKDPNYDSAYKFAAKSLVVCSIPMIICFPDDKTRKPEIYVEANTIDLAQFIGFAEGLIRADTIIIGDGVRSIDPYEKLAAKRAEAAYVSYDCMTEIALHMQAQNVKIIGEDPIKSLEDIYSFSSILQRLDMSEANLSECMNVTNLCWGCCSLTRIELSKLNPRCDCTLALQGTKYRSDSKPIYTAEGLIYTIDTINAEACKTEESSVFRRAT